MMAVTAASVLAFSFQRQRIILTGNAITRGLMGKYVHSYAFPDGRLRFRCHHENSMAVQGCYR